MSVRTPILVGIVIVVAVVAFSFLVMTTSKDRFGGDDNTYILYADFDDASGIRFKTRLQINGLDVGKIEKITHVRGDDGRLKARVMLRLLKEYPVYKNAVLRKVAESLLGDFRLDLDPGTNAAAIIPAEGIILNVVSRSDLEQIQESLKKVTSNVNDVTESLAHVLSGPEGEGSIKQILENVEKSMAAIEQTTRILSQVVSRNDQVIEGIIHDLGKLTSELASSASPGGDLKQLIENLSHLSARLDRIATSIDNMVGGESEVAAGGGQLRQTVDRLNETAAHLSNIARKIDEGKGSLGKVINDPTLANRAEETLENAKELVGGLSKLQTQIELRTQYEVPFPGASQDLISGVKNILALHIIPRPDKYYILEAISDPRGTQTRKIIATKDPEQPNGNVSQVEVVETSYNAVKFSAQLAKRYYFLTLRFGFIENTGGVGFNLHGLDDRLELRFDAFDFSRRDPVHNRDVYPRFRATGLLNLANHIYAQGGIDDPFNRELRTWFLGGALRFTDEDLKALLSVSSAVP
ncbi:MAG: MCE family protein [Deltaproteobacteria bacterium]|nr:MCE family protein [Deltaproteobacteria bacterium]